MLNDFETNFNIGNQWDDNGTIGAVYNTSLENLSGSAIDSWTITFAADFVITNIWNARIISYVNGVYTIGNVDWNGNVADGGRIDFGFQVEGNIDSISEVAVNNSPAGGGAVVGPDDGQEPTDPVTSPAVPTTGSFDATFQTTDQWSSGAVFDVSVNNVSGSDIAQWRITFDADFEITDIWNAEIISYSEVNGVYSYIVANAQWNGAVADNSDTKFGFQASGYPGSVTNIEVNDIAASSSWQNSVPSSGGGSGGGNPVVNPVPLVPLPEGPDTSDPTVNIDGTSIFTSEHYSDVLDKSMLFYYTQRSGDLSNPAQNQVWSDDAHLINWRGDSALNDGSDVGLDLTGGWYDAGDNVKLGFPMAYSTTTLAWGGLEFSAGYQASGAKDKLLDNLKWVNDYFLKAYDDKGTETVADDVFYGQVGNPFLDHSVWGAPEEMTMERPASAIDAQNPGSDLAGETAAAMASSSLLFRENGNVQYADTLIAKAEKLFEFAESYLGKYSDSIPDISTFYNSWSGYQDELAWASIWLYKATGKSEYLDKAEGYYQGGAVEFSWDDKRAGVGMLLAQETGKQQYVSDIQVFLNRWLDLQTTPGTDTNGGLAWHSQWGSNRYSANTAFIAQIYASYLDEQGGYDALVNNLFNFASDQIDYMMGDNPDSQSYVVGFGDNFPLNPHHRGASGVDDAHDANVVRIENGFAYDSNGNIVTDYHILYGALVGGPDQSGNYQDVRSDYIQNEVATDYNAGFSGALAGLLQRNINNQAVNTINGSDSDDSINGTADADSIIAGLGNDIIDAAAGDDVISGGDGADIITTGSGNDIINYEALADSLSSNRDVITDFTKGEDVFDLAALAEHGIIDINDLTITNDGTNTVISANSSDFEVELLGVFNLDEADFNWA